MPRKTKRRQTLIDLPICSQPARRATRGLEFPYASQFAANAGAHGNDCGPACVRMALDYLGLAPGVSIDAMAEIADSTDNGTNWNDLVSLAAKYGAAAMPVYLPANALPEAPAILLVRYPGFRRESVENQAYWDNATLNPDLWHWAWWLGNDVVDGQMVSVWNDPLYTSDRGKNVHHSIEELSAAFLPYGANRIAVVFPGLKNPPQTQPQSNPASPIPLEVFAFDSQGVRLRTAPNTQDPGNIIAMLPQGQRFTSLETTFMTREKMETGDQWLRVRTQVGDANREGYVAAWLVHEVGTRSVVAASIPSAKATWQDVINATFIACGRRGLNYNTVLDSVGFWNVFTPALRPLPYSGPDVSGWALAADLRQAIVDLLKLSSAELVDQASQVATDSAQKKEDDAAQRPSIIGIHGPPGVGCPPRSDWDTWIGRLQSMGVRWYKQCDDGDPNHREIFEWAKRLKQAGIEPIIRYFADQQFPNPLPDHYFEKMTLYASADIKWAEIGNEPNVDYEWQQSWNGRVNYNDPEVIRLLAEGWVHDAQRAVAAGVRPALYALGPTDWRGGSHPTFSSVYFASRLAIYLAEHRRDETIALFKQGAWFAVHCATFEQPNDFDALGQKPIWDMTLRGYEVVRKCFHDTFGAALDVDAIPIASTEGGVFTPDSTSMQNHERLHTDEEHGARMVSMFQWLEQHSPLMAMCPWCISAQGFGGPFDARFNDDGWFRQENSALKARAVVGAMQQLQASRSASSTREIQPSKRTPRSPTAVQRTVKQQLKELGITQNARPKSKKSTKMPSKPTTQAKEMTMPSTAPAHYALIIGIDCYLKNQMPDGSFYPSLNGCVNDANNMREFLRGKLGVPAQNITMLTSSNTGKEGQPAEPKAQWPIYENIVAGFKALGDKAKAGDHIYVHYSGHGGQASTAYPKLKGKAALDETLVPSDIGNSEARYVRDVEIAHLIQSLIDKKLIVTVVFDSCHSGGATRGASGVAVRGIGVVDTSKRPTNSDVAEVAMLQQTWRNTQTRSGTRAATVNSGWMQDTSGYVLIAACRSAELANEYRADGTSVNGALTYWLLDSLKQLGTGLTYRMLHQRVLARIHGQFEQQTPQMQGEIDRVVFGADKIALPEARINVLSVKGEQATLNAGQAQGLKVGAKLALYPIAGTSSDERLALAELIQVNVVDSIARITRVFDRAVQVQPGDQAVLLNGGDIRLNRAVRLVTQTALPKALKQSKTLADVQKAIQEVAGAWVKIVGDKAPADFQVALNAQGELEILDPAGKPLQLRPALLTSAADAPKQLAQRLVHLTKYRNVQAIANDDAPASLANGLLVEWVKKPRAGGRGGKTDLQPVAVGDRLTVKAGEQIYLRVKNLLPALPAPPGEPLPNTLNICVLDLTPSWSIDKIYPEQGTFEVLSPSEERLLPLQLSLPSGYAEGVDVLKVFATMGTATTAYDWLTLPELDQPPKARGTRGARGPLESLFAALAVDKPKTRQVRVQDTTSEPWTVVQVEVQVVA